ncbi:hypothetical protein F4775DRAFT_591820 [Biscogniauxia sp. FL1348]|nr:hypothetical protein F4775DRAFT_591820 [Biscogniauxia sp. FL1348]
MKTVSGRVYWGFYFTVFWSPVETKPSCVPDLAFSKAPEWSTGLLGNEAIARSSSIRSNRTSMQTNDQTSSAKTSPYSIF